MTTALEHNYLIATPQHTNTHTHAPCPHLASIHRPAKEGATEEEYFLSEFTPEVRGISDIKWLCSSTHGATYQIESDCVCL